MTSRHKITQTKPQNQKMSTPTQLKAAKFVRLLLNPVWPRLCAQCGDALTQAENVLCLRCQMQLPRINSTRYLVHIGAPGNRIAVRSWFSYSPTLPSHKLIHDIKYRDRRNLAQKLGREFGAELQADNFLEQNPVDIILPIPLHWSKHLKRSYNQAREIALGIADSLGTPVAKNLYAPHAHSTQTARNREERDANVRGIFALRHPEQLDGRHVAILDDVITTGATMFSAADTILAAASPASLTFLSLGQTNID